MDFGLRGLKIDTWYKATFSISSMMLIISFFVETKWITNREAILLFGGVWLISLAEWRMEKWAHAPFGQGFLRWRVKIKDPVNVIFELFGVVLIVLFILDILGIFKLP